MIKKIVFLLTLISSVTSYADSDYPVYMVFDNVQNSFDYYLYCDGSGQANSWDGQISAGTVTSLSVRNGNHNDNDKMTCKLYEGDDDNGQKDYEFIYNVEVDGPYKTFPEMTQVESGLTSHVCYDPNPGNEATIYLNSNTSGTNSSVTTTTTSTLNWVVTPGPNNVHYSLVMGQQIADLVAERVEAVLRDQSQSQSGEDDESVSFTVDISAEGSFDEGSQTFTIIVTNAVTLDSSDPNIQCTEYDENDVVPGW